MTDICILNTFYSNYSGREVTTEDKLLTVCTFVDLQYFLENEIKLKCSWPNQNNDVNLMK